MLFSWSWQSLRRVAAFQSFYKHFTTLSVKKQCGAFTVSSRAGFELIAHWSSDLGESSNPWVCAQTAQMLGRETNISDSLQDRFWVLQAILNAYIYNFLTHLFSDWLSSWGMHVLDLPGKAPKVKISFRVSEIWTVTAEFQMSLGLHSWIAFPCSCKCGQRVLRFESIFPLYNFSKCK